MTQPHHKIKQTVLSECHGALTISSTGTYATGVKLQRDPKRILALSKHTGCNRHSDGFTAVVVLVLR